MHSTGYGIVPAHFFIFLPGWIVGDDCGQYICINDLSQYLIRRQRASKSY